MEQVKAVAAQFVKLLRSQKDNCLMMTDLLTEYSKTFGYTLRLHDYDVSSVPALMQKLCHVVKVIFYRCSYPSKVWCVVLRNFLSQMLKTIFKVGAGNSKEIFNAVSIFL